MKIKILVVLSLISIANAQLKCLEQDHKFWLANPSPPSPVNTGYCVSPLIFSNCGKSNNRGCKECLNGFDQILKIKTLSCTEKYKTVVEKKTLSYLDCTKHVDSRYKWDWRVWAWVGGITIVSLGFSFYLCRKKNHVPKEDNEFIPGDHGFEPKYPDNYLSQHDSGN